MRSIIVLILMVFGSQVYASHIAGGEFKMRHLGGYQYKIDLIIYFDVVNGAAGAKDPNIVASIFRDSDDKFITAIILTLVEEGSLSPTQPDCSNGEILLNRLVYTNTIFLEPEIFGDPEGYYVAWERCCRNYSLNNIVSEDPASGGVASGQTFFLHFPPVIKGDSPFVNSSPELTTPKLDFGCPNKPFFIDFSGKDNDGDSLAYSVVVPWSTHSQVALPEIMPKPFPEVQWSPPFGIDNVMGGNPDLKINSNGLLTVTPQGLGLFAYAIKCEEFRNKNKIGEVRREFMLLVVDGCAQEMAPEISARSFNGTYSSDPLELHFNAATLEEERCIQVKVSDEDSDSDAENIRISAVPLGFKADISGILPSIVNTTLTPESSFAEFSICFGSCPLGTGDSFEIGIVAYDDACSVPLTDTVKVKVYYDEFEGCLEQGISFPQIPEITFGDSDLTLNATSSSGLEVTFSSSNLSVASVSSSTLTAHMPGEVSIIATQPGNGDYKAAGAVYQNICIKPQPPEIEIVIGDEPLQIKSNRETGNLWYRDGIQIGESSTDHITVSGEEAAYTARVVINGCVSQPSNSITASGPVDDEVDNPILATEDGTSAAVKIFPNPVSGDIMFNFPDRSTKIIELYGENGQRLYRGETSELTYSIDATRLTSGLYFAIVAVDSRSYLRRILKL
ncbi:MAG: T9SS type A sorting domain-containing protein [Cyclobacteriaceae bacterium]